LILCRFINDAPGAPTSQSTPQERLAAKALEGEQLAAAKEALRARLRAMEGKLIKVGEYFETTYACAAFAGGWV
jgi:hypothetical protein